jgi:hypothetical protein
LFALWLTTRVLEDRWIKDERGRRRHASQVERRISSLGISPALKRGISKLLDEFSEHEDGAPLESLAPLVQTAREGLGSEAAEALQRAARGSR